MARDTDASRAADAVDPASSASGFVVYPSSCSDQGSRPASDAPAPPREPMTCSKCGHDAGGAGPAGICIGCPCPEWHGPEVCSRNVTAMAGANLPHSDTVLIDHLDSLPSGITINGDARFPGMGMTPKQPGFSHTRDLIRQDIARRRAASPAQEATPGETWPDLAAAMLPDSRPMTRAQREAFDASANDQRQEPRLTMQGPTATSARPLGECLHGLREQPCPLCAPKPRPQEAHRGFFCLHCNPPRPGEAPAIQRVQQEDPKGCAVACLAMVSGRSYAEVRWTVNAAQVERGLADQTVVWWLNRYGLWHRRWWMDGEWGRPAPSSGVAIMLTHDAHWVVLVDGVVFDPARPEPLASYDFRQAVEVRPERALVLAVDPSWSSPTACAVSTYTRAAPTPEASAPRPEVLFGVCPACSYLYKVGEVCTKCGTFTPVQAGEVAPEATGAPERLGPGERIVRHPNGHLMVERFDPVPTPEEEAKALASLSKAWPVLAKHADHIDGEFDLALTDVRSMFARYRATVAALTAERDGLREVVQDYALVERHHESRAMGRTDLYRMPGSWGSSWFDSREACVTDWLRALTAERGARALGQEQNAGG